MSYWICDKDQNCIDCPKHYPEETCEHWIEVEPVKDIHTNGDRIRVMTDEELAEWLAVRINCEDGRCPAHASCVPSMEDMQCKDWICGWLKQEAV